MGAPAPFDRRKVASWALYDWANSAFATTVAAAFFPVFFREYWSTTAEAATVTYRWGMANALASGIIVVLAPLLGAIADRGSARKKFLLVFASMGICMTGSLYLVAQGDWFSSLLIFVLALVGFSGANVFYDALMVSVAPRDRLDRISALGYAVGYLGGGLLYAVNVCMTVWPRLFGLADASAAVRVSFITVAAWWAVFSIPLFLFVDEPGPAVFEGSGSAIMNGLRQLAVTFREIRKLRMAFLFLLAYWLYIDGVDTIIKMGIDYGLALGLGTRHLLLALGLIQFIGFPAAIAFGRIGERLGARNGLFIALGVYIGVTIWGYFMHTVGQFYGLAAAVGLVQGGVQSLSRSFFARLIPPDKAAEFFGFYNLLGKSAAIIGPMLMGWVSLVTGNPRLSILSIIVLFIAGAVLLSRVDEQRAAPTAPQLNTSIERR
jgi:MFS transporter, UMF1 family